MDRIGRYEIIRELGRGAMGVVYHARDPKIGREIAIKTIRLADKADPSEIANLRERLFREAQSAGALSHPGIVTIYDVDEIEGLAFIAMELVQGSTLETTLQRGRIEELDFTADVVRQAAAALDYAHTKSIVHRDVKPANLMLTGDGLVKIMDFGIARIGSSKLTQTGTVLGTPSYMSPEQVRGEEIDGRSDQFSLGVIAYEMLTGRKPFVGDSLTTVIYKVVSEAPQRVGDICPWVAPELDAAVEKALAKNPSERYDDCKAFAEAFAAGCQAAQQAGIGERPEPDSQAKRPIVDRAPFEPTLADATIPPPPPAGETEALPAERGLPPLPSSRAVVAAQEEADDARSGGAWKAALLLVALAILTALGTLVALIPAQLDEPRQAAETFVAENWPGLAERIPLLRPPEPPGDDPSPSVSFEPPELFNIPVGQGEEEADEPPPDDAAQPATNDDEPAETAAVESEPPKETAPAPPEAKPEIQPVRRQARTAPRPAYSSASVYFRTNPPGATIVLNNRADLRCKAPCRLDDLPAGSHELTARLEGYHTVARELLLGDQSQEVVEIDLDDARVTVLITSVPTGASIFVDGRRLPQKTNAKVPLAEGTYQIKVAKDGVGEAEQVVRVNRDEIPYAKFTLQK